MTSITVGAPPFQWLLPPATYAIGKDEAWGAGAKLSGWDGRLTGGAAATNGASSAIR